MDDGSEFGKVGISCWKSLSFEAKLWETLGLGLSLKLEAEEGRRGGEAEKRPEPRSKVTRESQLCWGRVCQILFLSYDYVPL